MAVMVEEGKKLSEPNVVPTKEEFVFIGWFKEAALVTAWDFKNDVVNTDITLYAKWIIATPEALETLIEDIQSINRRNYTDESLDELGNKLNAAHKILQLENPTTQQIVTAYRELSDATNALVALPHRAVEDIDVYDIIDGIVYVNQGEGVHLRAYAVNSGERATDSRVTFTCDDQLKTWVDGDIDIEGNMLWFNLKKTLMAGATATITVKSTENPTISKNVTLKIVGPGEIKTLFINTVNSLPALDKIEYEHHDIIYKAFKIYEYLTYNDREDPTVSAVYAKLEDYEIATSKLPSRVKYSFKGSVCTMIWMQGISTEEKLGKFTFAANGAFQLEYITKKIGKINIKLLSIQNYIKKRRHCHN